MKNKKKFVLMVVFGENLLKVAITFLISLKRFEKKKFRKTWYRSTHFFILVVNKIDIFG